jgi:outer membrane protein assembly factor BamB
MSRSLFRVFVIAAFAASILICPASGLPDKPDLLWQYRLGSEVGAAPAADAAIVFAATVDGKLAAVDHQGKVLWERKIEGGGFDASALITDSHIIIGSSTGLLYAFNKESGETAWTYSTDDTIQGNVVMTGPGRVAVIGQSMGSIHCIDTTTGKRVWKGEPTSRCDGSPAAVDDKIIFGNCDAALHVYSASDGSKLRSIALDEGGQVAAGVAVRGHIAIVGTHGGSIVCADMDSGTIIWTFAAQDSFTHATPVSDGKNVIAASNAGTVYCLDYSTGKIKWQIETDGQPESPVIAAEKVLISANGVLTILSLKTGHKLWSYEVSDNATAPELAGDLIFIAGDDGTLNAFGAK